MLALRIQSILNKASTTRKTKISKLQETIRRKIASEKKKSGSIVDLDEDDEDTKKMSTSLNS